MPGLGGDHRSRLDARRSGTDHADALAREVDALVRPLPRVVPVTPERLQPRNGGHVGSGQAADGGDEIFCDEGLARFRADMPAICRFVVMRRRNAGPELNVAFQVELVGYEIQVAQNFRLARIAFGPFPFPHQLEGKRVPVDMTFRVAPCTGVVITEPAPT